MKQKKTSERNAQMNKRTKKSTKAPSVENASSLRQALIKKKLQEKRAQLQKQKGTKNAVDEFKNGNTNEDNTSEDTSVEILHEAVIKKKLQEKRAQPQKQDDTKNAVEEFTNGNTNEDNTSEDTSVEILHEAVIKKKLQEKRAQPQKQDDTKNAVEEFTNGNTNDDNTCEDSSMEILYRKNEELKQLQENYKTLEAQLQASKQELKEANMNIENLQKVLQCKVLEADKWFAIIQNRPIIQSIPTDVTLHDNYEVPIIDGSSGQVINTALITESAIPISTSEPLSLVDSANAKEQENTLGVNIGGGILIDSNLYNLIMEKNDSMVVKNLMQHIWGDTLAGRSLTGTACRAKKGSLPKPPLTPEKVAALKAQLKKKIITDKPGITMKELEDRMAKFPKYVSEKIGSVQKSTSTSASYSSNFASNHNLQPEASSCTKSVADDSENYST